MNRILSSLKRLFVSQGKHKLKENLKIVWKQARQVQIVKDNEKKTVWTTAEQLQSS